MTRPTAVAIDEIPALCRQVHAEPVRPCGILPRVVDADAGPHADAGLIDFHPVILDADRAVQQAAAGQRRRDAQRFCQRTGAGKQRAIGLLLAAPLEHVLQAAVRSARADEHRVGHARRAGHDVEQVVDAVAEVDVRGAARAINRLGPAGPAVAVSMARPVRNAGIGLRFGDNHAGPPAVDLRYQDLSQQIAADGHDVVAQVE